MTELTVAQAAQHLGVHQSRVRQLARVGTLASRRLGRQWVIELAELDRHRELVRAGATSRPMSARVAWAAAALLDGQPTTWLEASERSRLVRRLRGAREPSTYQRWLLRRQSAVLRFRVADGDVQAVLHEPAVVATGIGAVAALGLGLGASGGEAYVTPDLVPLLVERYFLVSSTQGNLLLRTVDGLWHTRTAGAIGSLAVAPRASIAVDLLDGDDTRTRAAGRDLLSRTLADLEHQHSP